MRQLLDRIAWAVAAVSTTALVLVATGVVDAGSLDPSGPPGSTMKTLQEVEPRTPISSLPLTITQPGSYYLTGDLTGTAGQNGITVNAANVTIDLSGFTLKGVPGSLTGIHGGGDNVEVLNGTVTLWGFYGINLGELGAKIEDVRAIQNANGIRIRDGAANRCLALLNAGIGVYVLDGAIASGCVAVANQTGFQVEFAALYACGAAGNGTGIKATGATMTGCKAGNNGDGIVVMSTSVLSNNDASRNAQNGIVVNGEGSTISGNTASQNGAGNSGIYIPGNNNVIEGNTALGPAQTFGVYVSGDSNAVYGNSAHGNTVNYTLGGLGGSYGPTATVAAATNPFTNIDY